MKIKKIKLELSQSAYMILINMVRLYVEKDQSLERLILINLLPKLVKKIIDGKSIEFSLLAFEAYVIKNVLLSVTIEAPLGEENELRNTLFKLDEYLVSNQ